MVYGGRVDMFDVPSRRDYLDIVFRVVSMTSYVQYKLSLLSPLAIAVLVRPRLCLFLLRSLGVRFGGFSSPGSLVILLAEAQFL